MRIDLNPEAQPLPESNRTTGENAVNREVQSSAGSPVGEDRAQLSGTHAQIQALTAQAAQLPEAPQEKVSALRQMILGGNYQPSSEQLAGALFAHMLV
jgi:flagellar biosynthesis anti-sigma factor FlgM